MHGAAGGVGCMLVQLAQALGGHVTVTCSGHAGDMLRGLGADNIINYHTHNFTSVLQEER